MPYNNWLAACRIYYEIYTNVVYIPFVRHDFAKLVANQLSHPRNLKHLKIVPLISQTVLSIYNVYLT